ncbi:MAG TPA: biotin transporter BioY [Candidatus Obscuribacterales bacterium]
MQLVVVANNKEKVVRRKSRKSVVGQVVLVLLGLELMFMAAFSTFQLPIGTGHNLLNYAHLETRTLIAQLPERFKNPIVTRFPEINATPGNVRYGSYTAQAPLAIFIGYVLGLPLAPIAAALFLFLGLAGPLVHVHPFASGGGLGYYLEPGFGYLLGMIAATWVVGLITANKRTSLSQLLAVMTGLATVHLTGLLYLIGTCLVFGLFDGLGMMPSWHAWIFEEARNLSWYPLPYDFLFGLLAVGAGFPFRWLANMLTAPDITSRNQSNKIRELFQD